MTLVNNPVSVRKVPVVKGTLGLRDILSASNNKPVMGTKRPARRLKLALRFHHKAVIVGFAPIAMAKGDGWESPKPSSPEPLLAAAEVYSYST